MQGNLAQSIQALKRQQILHYQSAESQTTYVAAKDLLQRRRHCQHFLILDGNHLIEHRAQACQLIMGHARAGRLQHLCNSAEWIRESRAPDACMNAWMKAKQSSLHRYMLVHANSNVMAVMGSDETSSHLNVHVQMS